MIEYRRVLYVSRIREDEEMGRWKGRGSLGEKVEDFDRFAPNHNREAQHRSILHRRLNFEFKT